MGLFKGQIIDIPIHSIGSSGEGVGYFDKMAVFIEGALPEERVRAEVILVKKNYATAALLQVLSPSPHRVDPICPLFDRCGGCQIMHLAYEEQIELKRQRVAETLRRIGRLENLTVNPCQPSPQQLGYRNKIQLPIVLRGGQLIAGLYERQSHRILEVNHCYIHCALGEEVYQHVRSCLKTSSIIPYDENSAAGELRHVLIKSAVHSNKALVVLVTTGINEDKFIHLAKNLLQASSSIIGVIQNINRGRNNVILGETYTTLAGQPSMTETLLGLTFKVSPASFFQVNTPQAENLYSKVIEYCETDSSKTLLDVYCGVGTLALIASQTSKKVYGIECVSQAILDARENALTNSIENSLFECGAAESLIEKYSGVDITILNPPRKGCAPQVLESLIRAKTPRVVYVSCDPATLARDLSILASNGYRIDEVQPFDMFPQTMHVETAVKLTYDQFFNRPRYKIGHA